MSNEGVRADMSNDRTEIGATAVEYALMVALISIVIFGAVMAAGTTVQSLFQLAVDNWP